MNDVDKIWNNLNMPGTGKWARRYEFPAPIAVDDPTGVSRIVRERYYVHDATAAGGRGRTYVGDSRASAIGAYMRSMGKVLPFGARKDRRTKAHRTNLWDRSFRGPEARQ